MPHKDTAAAKEYFRKYREKNRDAISASKRKCYTAKTEYYREKARACYHANAEKCRAISRAWYHENRGLAMARAKQYRIKNAERLNRLDREGYRSPAGLNSVLKRTFGITIDEYNAMAERQGGVCAICHSKHKTMRLSVDHCHKTGRVRGLLCGKCNTGIGMLSDSLSLLESAKKYLEQYE